ncbi:MAG: phosphate propanoyltransferase [Clostridiaceae bacterium]|jgi:putative phosphotransacetylase|nr:phosphate propanoyltransferase [Clostridiaceae bacterium]
MDRGIVDIITEKVKKELVKEYLIPVEVSARHIHLSEEHMELLFGHENELTKKKELSQPGQYQYNERVMLIGPRGVISNVAVLGPVRKKTQVEITRTDSVALGINPPVRDSGDLEGSGTLFIASPLSMIKAEKSVIIAKRHIHMGSEDAKHFGVHDGELVSVRIFGQRPLIFEEVLIRVSDNYVLGMHLDFDEANAAGCTASTFCMICRSLRKDG